MDTSPRQYRLVGSDIIVCAALEAAGEALGRRLIVGRTCPNCGARLSGRRPLRHLAGTMLLELVLDGILFGVFVRRGQPALPEGGQIARDAATPEQQARIPQQRPAPHPMTVRPAAS